MEDVDMPSLVAYRNGFSSHNPDHVWNKLGHKEFLMQFGCYDLGRNTGKIRVDDTPQHKAVREAFTNALIHADLQMEGLAAP